MPNKNMKTQQHNLFYVPPDNFHGSRVTISGAVFHHVRHVLRKGEDQEVTIADGAGKHYRCRIVAITGRSLTAEIINQPPSVAQRRLRLDLAFVPLKGKRGDLILEKGTELGVNHFIPFLSRRAINHDLSAAKIKRYKSLCVSAMLQSRHFYLPKVFPRPDIKTLTETFSSYELVLVAEEKGDLNLPAQADSVLLITGPEGGFEPDEIEQMKAGGARLLSLGAYRLRAETAALTGIVKILTTYHII